jgi:integrase
MDKDGIANAKRRQYGDGGLSRLSTNAKDGRPRWRLTVRVAHENGERDQLTRNVIGTEAEAKRALKAFSKEIDEGRFADDKGLTFRSLLELFLAEVRRSSAPTTAELYERMLRSHAEHILGPMRVRAIQTAHIRRVLDTARNVSRTTKRGQRLSGRSIGNVRSYLHAALAYAMKEDYVPRNVVDQVRPPRHDHVERIDVDFDLANRILVAARSSDELRYIVAVALGSGLRRGELCALRWSDVDLENGWLTVRRAAKNIGRRGERTVIIGDTKTRSSLRTVVLLECARTALSDLRQAQKERDLAAGLGRRGDGVAVFDMLGMAQSQYGAWTAKERKRRSLLDPNELSRLFTRFVRDAKLPEGLRFHDLRHGFACLLFAAGCDLKTVSVWLGHSSVSVTAGVYVRHLGTAMFEEQARRVDEILSRRLATASG